MENDKRFLPAWDPKQTASVETNINFFIYKFVFQMRLTQAFLVFGGIFGSLLGAFLMTYIGRRYTIMSTGLMIFIKETLNYDELNLYRLLAGQVFFGIANSLIYSTFPIYVAEIARPKLRGALVILPIALRSTCILVITHLAHYLDKTILTCIGTVISVVFIIIMFFIPETPRWYVNNSRNNKARKALEWLRGCNLNIDNELRDLKRFKIEADRTKGCAFKQIFYMENSPMILMLLSLKLFHSLGGYLTVIHYPNMISSISLSIAHTVNIISFIATFIVLISVTWINRKILLYISSVLQILSLVSLISFTYFDFKLEWLLEGCLYINELGNSILDSISWVLLGEILPLKIRSIAGPLIIGANWALSFYNSIVGGRLMLTSVYGALFFFVIRNIRNILRTRNTW